MPSATQQPRALGSLKNRPAPSSVLLLHKLGLIRDIVGTRLRACLRKTIPLPDAAGSVDTFPCASTASAADWTMSRRFLRMNGLWAIRAAAAGQPLEAAHRSRPLPA